MSLGLSQFRGLGLLKLYGLSITVDNNLAKASSLLTKQCKRLKHEESLPEVSKLGLVGFYFLTRFVRAVGVINVFFWCAR